MNLQLGLGISSSLTSSEEEISSKNYEIENQELMGTSGNLGLELFDWRKSDHDRHHTPRTLPLLVWNDDQHLKNVTDYDDQTHTETNDKDENGVAGWPPIGSYRRRISNRSQGESGMIDWVEVENGSGNERERRGGSSLFVKVNMEGEGIGRKVDMSLYSSLHRLLQALFSMFGKDEESVHAYRLVYQDEDGLWQLAHAVPWGTFSRTAYRLKLLRKI